MSRTVSGLIFVLAWALALAGNAAAERKGFYGSLDLGIAIPEDVETLASDSDVPTNCDQHFSPITVKGIQLPRAAERPQLLARPGYMAERF